jgi:4'-phosphopantetheinyl transferase
MAVSAAEEPEGIGAGELHLWRIKLDEGDATADWSFLSRDERGRAAQHQVERRQRRFVVCRAALRRILSFYVRRGAHDLEFGYLARGKPVLLNPITRLEFSLARSRGLALIALSVQTKLGVDLEAIRMDFPVGDLMGHVLTPGEIERLRSLPLDARVAEFFRIWVIKEAFVKANGQGQSAVLTDLEADTLPVQVFQPAHGYTSAVAALGATPRMVRWFEFANHVDQG